MTSTQWTLDSNVSEQTPGSIKTEMATTKDSKQQKRKQLKLKAVPQKTKLFRASEPLMSVFMWGINHTVSDFLISDFARVHFICLNSHKDFKADVCNITRCNLGLSVECKNDTELKKKCVYQFMCVWYSRAKTCCKFTTIIGDQQKDACMMCK